MMTLARRRRQSRNFFIGLVQRQVDRMRIAPALRQPLRQPFGQQIAQLLLAVTMFQQPLGGIEAGSRSI